VLIEVLHDTIKSRPYQMTLALKEEEDVQQAAH